MYRLPMQWASPFVPCRKKGKLPCETVTAEYDLEYGSAAIELHKDSIKKGQKVVIVDDLIATGGTVKACASLVEELGGKVAKIGFSDGTCRLKGKRNNCRSMTCLHFQLFTKGNRPLLCRLLPGLSRGEHVSAYIYHLQGGAFHVRKNVQTERE